MAGGQDHEPMTVEFTTTEWHDAVRAVVTSATTVEQFLDDLNLSGDPRRDAWVFASARRLYAVLGDLDKLAEMLHDVSVRPLST